MWLVSPRESVTERLKQQIKGSTVTVFTSRTSNTQSGQPTPSYLKSDHVCVMVKPGEPDYPEFEPRSSISQVCSNLLLNLSMPGFPLLQNEGSNISWGLGRGLSGLMYNGI